MNSKLYKKVISHNNIYLAIYYIESYIQEKNLLSLSDRIYLKKLVDKFNIKLISRTIKKVRKIIIKLLKEDNSNEEYIETEVYFKPKKYNNETKEFEFRPIHSTSLLNQIALVSMLQVIVYELDSENKIIPSSLSRLLPSNFYGNRISFTGKELFKNWKLQYSEYIEKSEEFYAHCFETNEYHYEISLDLKQFFPNINPSILYNFILSKFNFIFNADDKKTFEKILQKLLIFKICPLNEIETKWYLQSDTEKEVKFVKGLPQGLPHTYFMANIFMLLVQDEYQKIFPGKMFFYVDDSIIFTNLKDIDFAKNIEELNKNLQNSFNGEFLKKEFLKDNITKGYQKEEFNIQVHEYNEKKNSKTNYNKIEKISKTNLMIRTLTRQVSEVQNFDFRLEDDNELKSYYHKIQSSIKMINYFENNNKIDGFNSYEIKRITSYKKFFSFRKVVIEYMIGEINLDTMLDNMNKELEEILNNINNQHYDNFIEKYVDDILNFSLSYLYTNIGGIKDEKIDKIDNLINELCKKIYQDCEKHSYFSIENYKKNNLPIRLYNMNKYSTLSNILNKFNYNNNFSLKLKNDLLHKLFTDDIKELFVTYSLKKIYSYTQLVRSNHEELERMFYNAIFSSIINITISDEISFNSFNQMDYAQLRLMMILRNPLFTYKEFSKIYNEIKMSKDEFKENVDYYILQVLSYFLKKVKKIQYIDNLILIHKYCADTWKNGSKFLHFYTIHNQEHAVSLIKLTKKLTVAFSLLQIKSLDYYLLFAACYLHDISMVTMPKFDNFISEDSPEIIKHYTNFINEFKINDYKKVKSLLLDNFRELDSHFENDIRKNHAASSSQEIREFPELSFIDAAHREIIAQVSVAHGYDAENVYRLKSHGKESLYNLKFMMILLRLADLLDINKQRISKVILDHNLDNLNSISRFHWLSHLITDESELYNEYETNLDDKNDNDVNNHDKFIIEHTIIHIKVSLPENIITDKLHCKNINCYPIRKSMDSFLLCIERSEKADTECTVTECNFTCKWFNKKNKYLINEIVALENYLNSINDNNYKSKITIVIDMKKESLLPQKHFDYLKSFVKDNN